MKSQPLRIALAMSAIFAMSFTIMWRQRPAQIPAVALDAKTQRDWDDSQALPFAPPLTAAAQPAAPPARPAAQSVTRPEAAAAAPVAVDSSAGDLPVDMHFRKRMDLGGKIEGSAVSNADAELIIDATILDPVTRETAKVQLDVAPYKGRPFGLDDGLDLKSGEIITLKSTPYRDKVVRVP